MPEEDCEYDCENCPYGLNQMECADLYEDWLVSGGLESDEMSSNP